MNVKNMKRILLKALKEEKKAKKKAKKEQEYGK